MAEFCSFSVEIVPLNSQLKMQSKVNALNRLAVNLRQCFFSAKNCKTKVAIKIAREIQSATARRGQFSPFTLIFSRIASKILKINSNFKI